MSVKLRPRPLPNADALWSILLTGRPTAEPVAANILWLNSGVLTSSVGIPPVITLQPATFNFSDGGTATFTITATGATDYQWQINTGDEFENINGATSTTYETGVLSAANDGDLYRCLVTGEGGTTISNIVSTLMAVALLLDEYTPTTVGAYSLRKTQNAYAGSAIRVRRSSDDTEQDIGFSGENLDTAAMLAFCGAGSGFVKTWYDQSGNGRDATQTTNANQPRIVLSGVVDQISSKPTLVFDGINDRLIIADGSILRNVSGMTISAFAQFKSIRTSPEVNYIFVASVGTSNAPARLALGSQNNNWVLFTRRLDADSASTVQTAGQNIDINYHHFMVVDLTARTCNLWVNSALIFNQSSWATAGNTSDTDSQGVAIGSTGDQIRFADARISEVIIGAAVPNATQRGILQDNTEIYYFGGVL